MGNAHLYAQKSEAPAGVSPSEASSEKTFPWDGGPDSIDVSNYPQEQQANYKTFAKKCSKCHTLARPINAPYGAQEWEPYVGKMRKKKRSGLDAKSAGKIIEFLKYDSSVRKKELIKKTGEESAE
ncbi:MAG: hypothetical protein A3G41_00340 [Elusimicrobia bacterium RIFCSPLOWO2_12_FULL_59_9]|nr:MAG: hypothetical protein A3G41_00340 [Elusimicrobia bacterium RIFCSPLOWO2_12_FULL_59_9]